MTIRTTLVVAILTACGGGKPHASSVATGCPSNITAAVTRAYPDAKQQTCEEENEDGKHIFEVKIARADGSNAEVEVATDGTITALEEVVHASTLPEAVSKAFAAKYPGAVASRAERITSPGKPAVFEIRFGDREAAFDESGGFIEEEASDSDDD